MRFRALIGVWVTAMLPASAATAQDRPRPVAVGYVPAFKGLDQIVATAALDRYTHINLAFVNPAPGGAVVAGDRMACMSGGAGGAVSLASFRAAVGAVHKVGAKVLISLGGGAIPGCSGDWATMLRPATRAAVVGNLVAFLDAEGLDGIDVDLEGAVLTAIDKEGNYVPFIAELGAALRQRGKLLTCATASYEGGMVPVASVPWFDLVNVMAYDWIGPSWGKPGDEHAPLAQAERDMALWRARGVPQERLVLGLPFYGYGYGKYRPNYTYREIVTEFGAGAARGDVVGKRCAGCDYITYNGTDTLARKAKLAMAQGAGVMVWEISQDTADAALIRAVLDAAGPDAASGSSPD